MSFDIDAIDAEFASATGTPEPDGLTPSDAMTILTKLAQQFPITGADMMELAPFTDSCNLGPKGSETTLKVAAEISAFLIQCMQK